MAISDAQVSKSEPRAVKIRRRKQSYGFKVRGQVSEGGPRWWIDGHQYRNLQTVSEVLPGSAAEIGGILPGDKILSINGIGIEGIEHEKFKELMRDASDEVELIVITPNEAKMLDIPDSFVLHRSDGTTLSIDDPAVLQSHNIDEAIREKEMNDRAVDVQIHSANSTIVEIDTKEEEKLDEELIDVCTPNEVDQNETGAKSDVAEAWLEDQPKHNISESCEVQLGDVIDEKQVDENSSISVSLDEENIDEKDESDSVADEHGDTPVDSVILNVENIEETSFIERDDSFEVNDPIESSCLCEEGMKQIPKKGKRILPKRPKVRPFSPDIFNSLAPYYYKSKIKSFEIEERPVHCWRYNQRPTSLSVLAPADAFRLESEHLQLSVFAWSSNMAKNRAPGKNTAKDDEKSRLRQDALNMHRAIDARKKSNKDCETKKRKTSYVSPYTMGSTGRTIKAYFSRM